MPQRQGYHHGNLREALIAAGLELTRVGGAAALTLRDATRKVGVSPNAAYRHFADRDSLQAAVAERIQHDMAAQMRGFQPPASVQEGSRPPGRHAAGSEPSAWATSASRWPSRDGSTPPSPMPARCRTRIRTPLRPGRCRC
ncbi:TetR/AcrR family transcriptional regulator [Microlunatus endophyticus]